jgi:hypothetical protein
LVGVGLFFGVVVLFLMVFTLYQKQANIYQIT